MFALHATYLFVVCLKLDSPERVIFVYCCMLFSRHRFFEKKLTFLELFAAFFMGFGTSLINSFDHIKFVKKRGLMFISSIFTNVFFTNSCFTRIFFKKLLTPYTYNRYTIIIWTEILQLFWWSFLDLMVQFTVGAKNGKIMLVGLHYYLKS